MDKYAALEALAALGQETRLDIFRLLVRAGSKGLLAGQIAEGVGGRQNTVSSHLAILARAGLIESERDGRTIRYVVRYSRAGDLVAYLLEDCCGGRPEVCAPLIANLSCLQPSEVRCD